jgi:hypothetical protein
MPLFSAISAITTAGAKPALSARLENGLLGQFCGWSTAYERSLSPTQDLGAFLFSSILNQDVDVLESVLLHRQSPTNWTDALPSG